jgi:hypothetical protein
MAVFDIPLSWGELLKRTAKETHEDDCLGLAAQLAYYFFLALFPAILFILAFASFFPLTNFIDEIVRALRPIAPAQTLAFLEEQLRRLSNADSGGILTIGIPRDTDTDPAEIQLARAEMTEKASRMAKGAGFIAGGVLLAYGRLLAIVAAVVLGLIASGLPAWAGALLGGIVVAGVGYVLIRSGLATLRPFELAPRQTMETLKEDVQWPRSQAR